MPVTWLHVSDFHIREGDPYDRNVVLGSLVSSVRRLREKDGRAPDLIFATGDIAFSGKPAEYAMATRFFDELLDAAGVDREHLFVIPGNHDVDRTLGVGLARTVTSREEADAYFGPKVPKAHIKQKLGAFVKWHNKYFRGIRSTPTNTTCGPVMEVPVNGIRVGLLPINSALFCEGDDDQSKLLIGRRALEPALKQLRGLKADISIALIHHPLDWLSDVDRSNIRADLQANFDVILRGHLHESDAEATVSAHGGFLHIAAGAAYQSRKWSNRALYGTFDGSEVTIFPIRYEDQPREMWVVDPSVFPEDARSGHARAFTIPRFAAAHVTSRAAEPAAPPIQQPSVHFRSNVQPRYHLPFVGRDVLLAEVDAALADASTEAALVLHGEPGVGKSELAREYARRSRQRYPGGTFVVRAGGGNEPVELANLGRVLLGLDFPDGLSIHEQAERTLMSLGGSPVLLIYDNAAGEDDVGKWLPPSGIPCHVLATSNSEAWSPGWRQLHVRRLPDDVSLNLIEKVGGKLVAERFGGDLVTVADGLPIQLVPVARALAYAERRGRLDSERIEMAKEARESFRVPYESLGDAERLLLHAAAYLNDQRIIRGELFRHLEAAAGWSDAEFRGRLDACLDLHVLEGNEVLRMHQLFAAFVRSTPALPALGEILRAVRVAQRDRLLEVATVLDENPAQVDLAMVLNGFRLRPEDWIDEGSELSAVEGEAIGIALYQTGKFDAARSWFERAVEEKQQGDAYGRVDHESLGRSLHKVGGCLLGVGKFEEARPWYERAVEVKQQGDVHGRVDHVSLGSSLHQLGYCLGVVGKYEEARPWFERAVEVKRQGDVHGQVDHESLGISLHQVGGSMSRVGKYEEARPWYERSVEEKQQGDVHGRVHHASIGRSLHEVGVCMSRVGKYEEARPWFERAVEEAQHGDVHGRVDHESLSASLHQVGYCLSSVGKYEEARPWFERAVEEAQQGDVHGRVDHASLGKSLHQVGYCLSSAGKYAEARPSFERAVEEGRQGDVHGRVDHESLGNGLHQVGYCLSSAGRHEEARPWYQRAVEEKRLGDIFGRVNNTSLRATLTAGAKCLREFGRTEEAAEWEAEAAKLAAG